MATIPFKSILDILALLHPDSAKNRNDPTRWRSEAIDPEDGLKIPVAVQAVSLEETSGLCLHLVVDKTPLRIEAMTLAGAHTRIEVDGVHDDDAELIFAYKGTKGTPLWAFDFKNVTFGLRDLRINTRFSP